MEDLDVKFIHYHLTSMSNGALFLQDILELLEIFEERFSLYYMNNDVISMLESSITAGCSTHCERVTLIIRATFIRKTHTIDIFKFIKT